MIVEIGEFYNNGLITFLVSIIISVPIFKKTRFCFDNVIFNHF